jgi:hypothetical protein
MRHRFGHDWDTAADGLLRNKLVALVEPRDEIRANAFDP